MSSKPIKVLLVDDSPVALTVLKRMLSSSPDIKVAGTAANGKEALDLIPSLLPDVICTDLHMPVMDGLEFTKEVMSRFPKPILVVSVSVREGSLNVFKLLEAGAVDVFTKPRGGLNEESRMQASELISKIRILSGVHVFRRPTLTPPLSLKKMAKGERVVAEAPVRIVVIGASTGGPQALEAILSRLPAEFPLPIICVQHISDGFLHGLVNWLATMCRMKVRIARPGEFPFPGTIYFPGEGTHLKIDIGGKFVSSTEPPLDGHRPSISVTMRSVAHYYGSAAAGVLLTGMGRDGADGMRIIAQAGGVTIVQDEASSVVYGMPKQAIELGAASCIVPLDEIADTLMSVVNGKGNQCQKK